MGRIIHPEKITTRGMGGIPLQSSLGKEEKWVGMCSEKSYNGRRGKFDASRIKDCCNEDIGQNTLCIPYFGKWEKEWVGLLFD